MIKKINDFLAGWQMTITGGVFLLASFILPRMGYGKYELLAWPCVIICGLPLLYLAIYRIIYNKGISKISSALLISMAMIAALLIGDLFAAGEVAFIMELGALLEDMTTDRAKKGLKNLISLAPSTGRLILDGKETIIPVERIQKDDVIRVLPGETIPVDGIIIAGETSIDQSVMTGESLPVDKTVGDSVYSGTINRFGSIDFKATKVGQDSSLQKLIKMVEDADKNQASTQRIADKWASWLVPVALFIAILAYVITGDIVRAVTVMVVFCPCALVLATPTAIMAAIGQATKHGVIIKSGEALEKMGKVSTIAFDKTGTLTYGKLEVTDIIPTRELPETDLLRIAASIESRSEHPLGKAVVEKAKANDLELADISDFKMEAGKGITATINNAKYYLGSETYIKNIGVSMPQNATTVLNNLGLEGKATIVIAEENNTIGIIGLSDIIRPEAREVIRQLETMNTNTLLLTGDNLKTASFFASKVGINDVHAGLLPGEKMDYIKKFKENGKICMIGDGINDAPALKLADVGVAMGAMGSDIAIEAADVALMSDDITNLPYLKWLSNTTVKTIKAAITLSMCINLVAVTMSVLGILNPTTGALVHNAGSCFVVLLAALLYDRNYSFN